jgi:hypothetical protein
VWQQQPQPRAATISAPDTPGLGKGMPVVVAWNQCIAPSDPERKQLSFRCFPTGEALRGARTRPRDGRGKRCARAPTSPCLLRPEGRRGFVGLRLRSHGSSEDEGALVWSKAGRRPACTS